MVEQQWYLLPDGTLTDKKQDVLEYDNNYWNDILPIIDTEV